MKTYEFSSETRSFLENIPIPLAVYQYVDDQIKPLLVSRAYRDLFGYDSCGEAVYSLNTDLYRNVHPDDIVRMEEYSYQFANRSGDYDIVFRNRREDQQEYHVIHGTGKYISVNGADIAFITYTDETDDAGDDSVVKAMLTTLSDRRSSSGSTEFSKHYDELTGLQNMSHFLGYSMTGIEKIWEKGEIPVILYFDLCDLKVYNSRFGFRAGDGQICKLAKLIRNYFGAENSSRFENDHFVVYAENQDIESRLHELFLQMKHEEGGENLAVKVGIFPFNNDGTRLTEACDRARMACGFIPKTRTSTFLWFDEGMVRKTSFKYYIMRNFEKALENGWIQVYYQPVIRTMTRTVCGGEALVRWMDPEYGRIAPGQFIPILEDTGQIYRLDLYVFEQVCRDHVRMERNGEEMSPISVNLSRKDFLQDDLPDAIDRISQKYGVPREFTNLEITESAFIRNVEKLGPFIRRFHQLGYNVWMDDFGSGYSSLGILKDYSFDELKLDMTFLENFNERSKTIITAIVRMAKELDISTLAEGVETEEQYQFLKKIGCEKMQGFCFFRPMPAGDLSVQLKKRGFVVERAKWRSYFNRLSRIDYLTDKPLCVVDDDGRRLTILFANQAYREILKRDHVCDLKDWETKLNTPGDPIHIFHRQYADQQLRKLEGTQTTAYPSRDHYMQLTGQVAAVQDDHYLYTMQIQYVDIGTGNARQINLETMSDLYYMCSDIAIYDLENDTVEGVKSSLSDQPMGTGVEQKTISSVILAWKEEYCYFPDRDRFGEFADVSTMRSRMEQNEDHALTGLFRSITASGEYHWFLHLIMPVQRSDFNRAMHVTIEAGLREDDLKKMISSLSDAASGRQKEGVTDEIIWKNIVLNAKRMFFWKDVNRRFLGASQSFLDYFGIDSEKEIIGKTDEDMEWHIDPDPFRKDEEAVIRSGKRVFLRRGKCIVNGVNRDIIASKIPIYRDGRILGLVGNVFDVEMSERFLREEKKRSGVDEITGLANARGISDSVYSYLLEHWRTGNNVAMIEVYVPEYSEIIRLYGDDSGNSLLQKIGTVLRDCAGKNCVIGRVRNSLFHILTFYNSKEEVRNLARKIRPAVESMRRAGQWSGNCSVVITVSYTDANSSDKESYIDGLANMVLNTRDCEKL